MEKWNSYKHGDTQCGRQICRNDKQYKSMDPSRSPDGDGVFMDRIEVPQKSSSSLQPVFRNSSSLNPDTFCVIENWRQATVLSEQKPKGSYVHQRNIIG